MIIQEYFYIATSALQCSVLPATDAAIVALSLYAVSRNKAPLSKRFCGSTTLLTCVTIAALTVHSSVTWTSLLFSFATLLSSILSASTTDHIWFLAFHLLGVYRALSDSSYIWNKVIYALLHIFLVLANLGPSSKSLLEQVFQQCTYAQERYLYKLQKLRQLEFNDIWPLPNRFQLHTVYSELKYNTNESYFVLRAVFRMMWRPLIPVYIVGLLLQFIPLIQLKLNRNIVHNINDLSSYSMYMIVADVLRIVIVQLLDTQHNVLRWYIYKEMDRAKNAIDFELFRLPLTRQGLRRPIDTGSAEYYIRELTEFPGVIYSAINAVMSMLITASVLYRQMDWYMLITLAMPYAFQALRYALELSIGRNPNLVVSSGVLNPPVNENDVIKGIRAIKIFAWEQMFLDPAPHKTSIPKKSLPWYGPVFKIVWDLFDLASFVTNDLSVLMCLYFHSHVPSMSGVGISTAKILEIDLLLNDFRNGKGLIERLIPRFKYMLEDDGALDIVLKGDYLNSLPHSEVTTEVGPLVEMNNCSFTWGTGDDAKNVLTDVSLNAGAGELVAIVGKTGAGKSSLLLSMCSEVEMTQGTGRLVGKIAYLEQQPWIMNDTLRANILFGREYDEDYYWKVLNACALADDLEMWPNSDMTVIGENGINISGGQRARLALARTVYSRADIYFLDDPLSAVDAIVKRHILDNIILSTGLLGGKLRFVTTHADNILPLCNQIITIDKGCVSVKVQTPQIHTAFKLKAISTNRPGYVDGTDKSILNESASDDTHMDIVSDKSTDLDTGASDSESDSNSEGTKSSKKWSHWSNALYAIRICGTQVVASYLVSELFKHILRILFEVYQLDALKSNSKSRTASYSAMLRYIGIKLLGRISTNTIRRIQRYWDSALRNGEYEHRVTGMLIRSLLSAPLSYFEDNQSSSISSNLRSAKSSIRWSVPFYLSGSCSRVISALTLIIHITVSAPWFMLCIPLFVGMSHFVKKGLDPLETALEKFDNNVNNDYDRNTRLAEDGAQMIRLFGVESYFTTNYVKGAGNKTRLSMLRSSVSDLGYQLGEMVHVVLRSSMLYLYVALSKLGGHSIQAGDIAMFQKNLESLELTIDTILEFPKETLEILEKVGDFRNLVERDPEAPYVVESCRTPAQWPPNGKIEFHNYSMKYGSHLDYALKNINLTINPGEKIGIVGRTGAGKSSLAKVLFRLIHENTSGSILIDGQDISEFGIGDYRPRLGMVPQESSMFGGSIRRNLDPLHQYDVEEMWASLIKCNLSELVSSKEIPNNTPEKISTYEEIQARRRDAWQKAGWFKRMLLFVLKKMPATLVTAEKAKSSGLDKSVEKCFGKFSSGQQQLFGLCRVIMRRRKIVVLDEATANVDLETDKLVQELIRKEFRDCTVLTIAHRLETIMNSDRIIVMDKGTISEVGTPQELLAKDGMFAQLVKTSEF